MAKSLRDEVEALAVELERYRGDPGDYGRGRESKAEWTADRLREILSRHPAADGVVVPRDLFEAMRDDQIRYLGAKVMRGLTDGNDELQKRLEQADAILSTDSGIERAEGKS